jgi:ABC-2 type transport system ATP-binding protein
VIEVSGLRKAYDGRTVLDDVDLVVRPGELLALLGPNGAGKTTTVEIVEGYRGADAGTIRVLGQDPRRGGPALKARVGLMLQGGVGLEPRASARDLVRLYCAFHEGARKPDDLLEQVGLASVAGTRARRLSGGERQRLSLALALAGDPEVLILDEPTAGMDPEARRDTRKLVASLRGEGRTILLTTHDLGDVEALADRVAILASGRIVADAPPEELMHGGETAIRFRLHAPPAPESIAKLAGRLAARDRRVSLRPIARTGDAANPGDVTTFEISLGAASADIVSDVSTWAAREGLLVTELRAGAASLEERYLELTGDRSAEGPG